MYVPIVSGVGWENSELPGRVEPSPTGGRKIADALLDVIGERQRNDGWGKADGWGEEDDVRATHFIVIVLYDVAMRYSYFEKNKCYN